MVLNLDLGLGSDHGSDKSTKFSTYLGSTAVGRTSDQPARARAPELISAHYSSRVRWSTVDMRVLSTGVHELHHPLSFGNLL